MSIRFVHGCRRYLQADDLGNGLPAVEFVSPQVGSELAERGALAMVVALMMIFVYVMIRFQWKFSAGAVAALAHDAIVTVGFFSVFGLPFDLTVVAAILAVIGYSLNDTVVAFDRIRENFFGLRGPSAEDDDEHLDQRNARANHNHRRYDLACTGRFAGAGWRVHRAVFDRTDRRNHRRYLFVDLHGECDSTWS